MLRFAGLCMAAQTTLTKVGKHIFGMSLGR